MAFSSSHWLTTEPRRNQKPATKVKKVKTPPNKSYTHWNQSNGSVLCHILSMWGYKVKTHTNTNGAVTLCMHSKQFPCLSHWYLISLVDFFMTLGTCSVLFCIFLHIVEHKMTFPLIIPLYSHQTKLAYHCLELNNFPSSHAWRQTFSHTHKQAHVHTKAGIIDQKKLFIEQNRTFQSTCYLIWF